MKKQQYFEIPLSIIRLAESLGKEEEKDYKIPYVILDWGVETLIRFALKKPIYYIGKEDYPISKLAKKYEHYELLNAVDEHYKDNVSFNIKDIGIFHELRNDIYHDPLGRAAAKTKYNDYLALANKLVEDLVGKDDNENLFSNVIT